MGIDYTNGVMFGAFAKEGAAAHKSLAALYDEQNGDADVPGIGNASVVRRGNLMSGDFWYAVQVGPSHSMTSRRGGYAGPYQIEPTAPADVVRAIDALGLSRDDFTDVGLFVYQDVW